MSENPYAPPGVDVVGEAPRSRGWEVTGKSVLVSREAIFPMIDPYSGKSEEMMALRRLVIRRNVFGKVMLLFIGVAALVLPWTLREPAVFADASVSFVVVGLFTSLLVNQLLAPVSVQVFFTPARLRRRLFFIRIILSGAAACLVLLVAGILIDLPDWAMSLPQLMLWPVLLGALAQAFQRRLKCRRKIGDQFEIHGFHPQALEELRRLQEQRMR